MAKATKKVSSKKSSRKSSTSKSIDKTKIVSKSNTKTKKAAKSAAKTTDKPKAKTTAKTKSKTATKIKPKTVAKSKAKTAAKSKAKTVAKSKAKTAAKTKPKTVAKSKAKTAAKIKPKTVAKSKAKTAAKTKPKTVAKSKAKTAAKTKPKTVAKSKAKTVAKTKPKTVAKSKVKTVAKNTPKKVLKPKSKVAVNKKGDILSKKGLKAVKENNIVKPTSKKALKTKSVKSKSEMLANEKKLVELTTASAKVGESKHNQKSRFIVSTNLADNFSDKKSGTAIKTGSNTMIKTQKPLTPKKAVDLVSKESTSLTHVIAGNLEIAPYQPSHDETYMSEQQKEHFRTILDATKQQLMEDVDRTVTNMRDDDKTLSDFTDRATKEEEINFMLRTRNREGKLLRKINDALDRIDDDDFGYCESCGVEIGIRRLEARPTATLCIDCKTLDEIKEKQRTL